MRRNEESKSLLVGAVFAFFFMILAGVMLTTSRAKAADTVSSNTSVTVSSSCQLDSVVDIAHEAEVTASTYLPDIGKTTITATCNDVNGFDVYAVGYTNTEYGRNDMLGAATGRTIDTGTATSGGTSNWAMKLASVAGTVSPTITTGYNAYHAIPDDYTKVATYSGSTAAVATGSQFETTYAVFAASTQAPDTYNGRVKYTLVHPSDAAIAPCVHNYTIIYNSNGGSGNMDTQTACVDKAIGLLPNGFTAPVPSADNQFVVWNTEPDGSGYTYHSGQSVTNLASGNESVTLYAMWAPKYMQDFTTSICQIVASQEPFKVYDRRDGSDYTVRYIKDACWMTQNLRITGTVSKQLSNFSTYDNVDVCTNDLTAGNSDLEPRCHDSGNASNGVWYNFTAATANTITGSPGTVATEDICPAGWHLPNYNEIGTLTGNALVSAAFTPVIGGYYGGGTINNPGTGYWWSTQIYCAGTCPYRWYLSYSGGNLGRS